MNYGAEIFNVKDKDDNHIAYYIIESYMIFDKVMKLIKDAHPEFSKKNSGSIEIEDLPGDYEDYE